MSFAHPLSLCWWCHRLCLEGWKLSSRVWGGFCRWSSSPSCGEKVESSCKRMGRKLGCWKLFITDVEDNVSHNWCPWCDWADVVWWVTDRWKETDASDMTWFLMRLLSGLFGKKISANKDDLKKTCFFLFSYFVLISYCFAFILFCYCLLLIYFLIKFNIIYQFKSVHLFD